jgi:hypothetical protein
MLLSQASSEQEAEDKFCAGFLFCLLFTHYNVVMCFSEISVNYGGLQHCITEVSNNKAIPYRLWRPIGL